MIVILACGGRTYGRTDHLPRNTMTEEAYVIAFARANAERRFLRTTLDRLAKNQSGPVKFVAGEAKGADTGARIFAQRNDYGYEGFKANWHDEGYAAGPIRNKRMYDVSRPKIVVGFCGGNGTAHMINYARKQGCEHVLHYTDGDIDNFMASSAFQR